ncbi:MAG: hypothetical protein J4G10_05400 [Alphaproteobacteria bacterium]|nr:hypothetical protein [Alphaproteobacteria bacterium]
MVKDIAALRKRVHAVLPSLMEKALSGYRHFATEPPPQDPKGFAAHHVACKAALAHMELLIRLARWAETEGHGDETGGEDVSKLIAEARAALVNLVDEE